ncbi:hypothetical protein HBI49_089120 [Parastagonospora nodorum]|nr:hypothetical protein HBH61_095010 [Parastagonospora nodorum]KAH5015004.1 hypothetical protein HBI74_177520 [Parastagonospora nodorum]KAH5058143.1 hypothetical protein HBH96_100820 [Parastagonospora nodorum]KAH5079837.1 hypothetical protein HBH95_084170 [Parastagonospora nodorum]KAH5216256.1 hypothetical protein HBI62_169660 [Parastagonospora nodorum]
MSKEDDSRDASTASPTSESRERLSGHAARYAKVHQFFGFSHGYNFPLWVVFAGGMLGFSLSRLPDLDYDGHFREKFALVPGYWYYFGFGHYRYGMLIHLASVLPAGILMVFQFTPVIRHKFITFHRINGYIVLLLCLVSNASAFVIIPHKQGGNRITSHAVEMLMCIITTIGIFMAWWNIRRKQIDQHRAWMIRTMFYMGVTITARLINLAAGKVISRFGNYWSVWMCDEISFLYTNLGMDFPKADYQECFLPDGSLDRWKRVAVHAVQNHAKLEQLGSNAVAPFGTMLWICLFLHVVGVELYLRMTPKETERLRRVSYEKQLEAGFRNPGSAGIVLDRWGDADAWTPAK